MELFWIFFIKLSFVILGICLFLVSIDEVFFK